MRVWNSEIRVVDFGPGIRDVLVGPRFEAIPAALFLREASPLITLDKPTQGEL